MGDLSAHGRPDRRRDLTMTPLEPHQPDRDLDPVAPGFHSRNRPGEDAPKAIVVDHVRKRFRLYHERNQSLKARLVRGKSRYEEFWAINDVTFDIREGETFGIIGENGSGKSTMLKTLAKILKPDDGAIQVVGKMSALLELGAGFHPELSGRENVYLNGSILGLTKKQVDERFDDIVSFAGLEQFIDMPVKNYSSGMYVRLGFSVAINVDPDILLIDEVLSVGDESFQRRCMEKFAELQQRGKTVVIVSHAIGLIRMLCDRAVWLNKGRVEAAGTANDVCDAYIGSVHVEQVHEAGVGVARRGTGEATITQVELLADGAACTQLATGQQATVRIHYCVNGKPVERPTLGFAMHRTDGIHVTGVNIRETGMVPTLLAGEGWFDYVIDHLPLLAGTYQVSAAIQDYLCAHTYDWWQDAIRFEVIPGWIREAEGVLTFLGHWEHPQGKTVGPNRMF